MNFPERLKVVRKDQNLTQKQVAIGIEILEQAYQRYEYGNKIPGIDKLEKLCRYFNVSADYLLGLTDEPRPLNDERREASG